jgi:hypothetical protein
LEKLVSRAWLGLRAKTIRCEETGAGGRDPALLGVSA